jgi:hypothetical protein
MISQTGSIKSGVPLTAADTNRKPGTHPQKTRTEAPPAYTLELSGNENAAAKITGTLESRGLTGLGESASSAAEALRRVVEKLISRQNGSSAFSLNIQVTGISSASMTQAEAAAAISENGDWGVEAVSDRIVSFAKSLAGDDAGKIETLREAIDKGFASVKNALGGKLPDISTQTYDAVMSKLDDWAAGADTVTE